MTPPRTYPGRDKRRLLRRAKELQHATVAQTNQRSRCCRKPAPRQVPDVAVFTTKCANCGATV